MKAPQVCWKQQLALLSATQALTAQLVQNEESWEQISQELGWTVADCLNHKLSFKKKEDPKAKHEAMGQHIKRLRAAGWHLLHIMERSASFSVQSCFQYLTRPHHSETFSGCVSMSMLLQA